jgi:hypothetical protein
LQVLFCAVFLALGLALRAAQGLWASYRGARAGSAEWDAQRCGPADMV